MGCSQSSIHTLVPTTSAKNNGLKDPTTSINEKILIKKSTATKPNMAFRPALIKEGSFVAQMLSKSSLLGSIKTSNSSNLHSLGLPASKSAIMTADLDQETLVSLFGNLYKLRKSTGSLEELCEDKKQRIFLVTPLEADETASTAENRIIASATYVMGEDETNKSPLIIPNLPRPPTIQRGLTKRRTILRQIQEEAPDSHVPAPSIPPVTAKINTIKSTVIEAPETKSPVNQTQATLAPLVKFQKTNPRSLENIDTTSSVTNDTPPTLLRETFAKLGSPIQDGDLVRHSQVFIVDLAHTWDRDIVSFPSSEVISAKASVVSSQKASLNNTDSYSSFATTGDVDADLPSSFPVGGLRKAMSVRETVRRKKTERDAARVAAAEKKTQLRDHGDDGNSASEDASFRTNTSSSKEKTASGRSLDRASSLPTPNDNPKP